MNIENAKKIGEILMTPHNPDQLNNELSPHGLYEIIKNFFTFGGVRREKTKYYKEFYDEMAKAIVTNSIRDEKSIPNDFTVHVNKFTIYFERNNKIDKYSSSWREAVTIKIVSSDMREPLEFDINAFTFRKVCTVLLVREKIGNDAHRYESLLTEDGKMNFRDHIFNETSPVDINYANSCLDQAILKWDNFHEIARNDLFSETSIDTLDW